ncbi:hypothetical protein [Photobacterium frigidiphilum]|nr:hypothetical protein [Photobacterium frigidiphilum]
MSDSDNTLLAAVAMRAKKNAIDQGGHASADTGVSITAKVKALSEAGFSDGEIDKILAVEGAQPAASQDEHMAATEEYNEQVDESIHFTKVNAVIIMAGVFGLFISVLLPISPKEGFLPTVLWVGGCIAILLIRTIPFAFKKAGYFLKR